MANVADTTTAVTDITTAFTEITTAFADITTAFTDITTTFTDITTAATDIITTSTAGPPPPTVLVDPLTVAQVVAMLVLGLGSFVLGVAPLALVRQCAADPARRPRHSPPRRPASGSWAVSLVQCFGGGMLLCTTLIHMQPEIRAAVAAHQRAGSLGGSELLADMLFCAGFFLVPALDELTLTMLAWCRGRAQLRLVADGPSAGVGLINLKRETAGQEQGQESSSLEDESTESQQQQQRLQQQQQQQQQQEPGDDVEKQQRAATSDGHRTRGTLAVLGPSFHGIFEGMAIGLESWADHVWYLLVAVAVHKLVVAFHAGLETAWSSGRRPAVIVAYAATFAVVMPAGIACGMAVTRFGSSTDASPSPVAAVLHALAAGTLLYVLFFEMLVRHRQSGCCRLAATVIGFCTLPALQMLTHHHHGNQHVRDSKNFGHNQGHFHHHGNHEHYHNH